MKLTLLNAFIVVVCCGFCSGNEECVQGFMDYSLLVQKASQIPMTGGKGSLSDKGLGSSDSGTLYAMPSLTFTCPGQITGFLLGADVRIDSKRDAYPSVGLLNVHTIGVTTYSIVAGSFRSINISAEDFSTVGVFQYELSSPINYIANQILGIYQPNIENSTVRLYYEDYEGQNILSIQYVVFGKVDHANSRPLLHPVIDNECSTGFIPKDDIRKKATMITTVNSSYETAFGTDRLYKDIKFTCDGIVTHVIIGTMDNPGQSSNPPEVHFWRSNNDVYTQSGSAIKLYYNNATEDVSTDYLRWYNLSKPLPVTQGDILGIYHHQPTSEADCVIYYQQFSGPLNYNSSSEETGYNLYPLVSVVFETSTYSTTSSALITGISTSSTTTSEDLFASSSTSETSTYSTTSTALITGISTSSTTTSKNLFGSLSTSESAFTARSSLITTTSDSSVSIFEASDTTATSTSEGIFSAGSSVVTTGSSSSLSIFETGDVTAMSSSESVSTTQSSPVASSSSLRNFGTSITSSSIADLSRTRLSYSISSSTSQSPLPEIASVERNTGGILAGAVVSTIIFILLIATLAVVTFLVWLKKRQKRQVREMNADDDSTSLSGINNIVYQSNTMPINGPELGIGFSNALYEEKPKENENLLNIVYEPVAHPAYGKVDSETRDFVTGTSEFKSFENPVYEGNDNQSTKHTVNRNDPSSIEYFEIEKPIPGTSGTEAVYSLLQDNMLGTVSNALYMTQNADDIHSIQQFGLCVPSNVQRDQLDLTGNKEDIYGKLVDTQHLCKENNPEGFFDEEAIYWQPGTDIKNIYEQLARKRYREIPQYEIRIISHLGSGQFGTVDKGVWTTDKGPVDVAIKTLTGEATEEEELKFLQEAAINGQFHHPNVIKLHGVVTVGKPTMIILEFMPFGDLKAFLEAVRPAPGELPDDSLAISLCNFSHQVACGMFYLSEKRFIHRDLAARNILVGDGHICKIADFGMSRDLQDENYYISNSRRIPVKWTAPEALHFRKYSTQSDVWSFGAVLYEIWSIGYKPFEDNTNQECVQLVDSGYRLPPPPGCPRMVYEMMIQCWHPTSSSRPTFKYLKSQLEHTKAIASQAGHLGTGLVNGLSLYPDIQQRYQ